MTVSGVHTIAGCIAVVYSYFFIETLQSYQSRPIFQTHTTPRQSHKFRKRKKKGQSV
jgi:hypothetical protein